MGSEPNWKQNMSASVLYKKISMLRGLEVSSLARKCVFYRLELTGKWGAHRTEIKFFKFKTEMYQQIELKE